METQPLLTFLAIAAVLVASFLAGRKSFGATAPYDVAEVVETAVKECAEGQYLGDCKDCKTCGRNEYEAGGCSYFQDTFCTLCEPIAHCPQNNIICTNKFDNTCTKCDPGYWGPDCKPCTVCSNNFFEDSKCVQDADTVCLPCSTCSESQFVVKECQYRSKKKVSGDTQCGECTVCEVGSFTYEKCQNMGQYVDGNKLTLPDVYTTTPDTVCQPCTQCQTGSFVESTCTIEFDTTCTACTTCADGTYIDSLCEKGEPLLNGVDTKCADCTQKPLGVTHWEVFHCGGVSDALYKECSVCQNGEYEKESCSETSDTVCPDCESINHCVDGALRCTSLDDESCEECEEGFMSADCCYQKTFEDCGTTTSRERIAARYGFDIRADDASNEKFIETCMMLCDEMPDCMAFEVVDGADGTADASGMNDFVSKDATCYFKSSYTARPKGDVSRDCYSNVCNQGVDRINW